MKQRIGFFDSGVGGLSLLPAVQNSLPHEDIIYIADHGFFPYGEKSKEAMLNRAKQLTEALIEQQCKLIVVACNTVTTQLIDILREQYNLPFIGIEPAIKPAALQTKTGVVGVLATKGTLKSERYYQNSLHHTTGIRIVEQIGEGLVNIVEEDAVEDEATLALLSKLVMPMVGENIDTLVLGCTHYPLLTPSLKKILPESVEILDNSKAVAQQIEKVLKKEELLSLDKSTGETHYFTTGDTLSWKNITFTPLPL